MLRSLCMIHSYPCANRHTHSFCSQLRIALLQSKAMVHFVLLFAGIRQLNTLIHISQSHWLTRTTNILYEHNIYSLTIIVIRIEIWWLSNFPCCKRDFLTANCIVRECGRVLASVSRVCFCLRRKGEFSTCYSGQRNICTLNLCPKIQKFVPQWLLSSDNF